MVLSGLRTFCFRSAMVSEHTLGKTTVKGVTLLASEIPEI